MNNAIHRFRAARQSRACCAHAHSENRHQTEKNKQAYFFGLLPVFLCPEAFVATFKLQAQIACYAIQAGSPGEVQEAKSPGAGFRAAEALTFLVPIPAFNQRYHLN